MKRRGTGRRRKSRHVPVRFFIMTGVIIIICMLLACHVMRDIIRTKYGRNSQDKSSSHSIAHSEPIPGGGTGKAKKEGNLFTEQRNSKGELEMVQADSVKINLLMSQLAMNIQEEFSCNGRESSPVSFGTLIGSRVLSQSKPDMTITVMPLSVSSMDFRTEFETQGINQTKYKIYVILECQCQDACTVLHRDIQGEEYRAGSGDRYPGHRTGQLRSGAEGDRYSTPHDDSNTYIQTVFSGY